MITLAKFSIRRPKTALAIWLVVAAALAAIGFGVSSTLSPSITVIPGTQSSRAQDLGKAQFGPTQLVPILLEGPKAQLNREGPPLVSALAKRPYTRVLSAWDAGTASKGLRPKPTAAMIVVSVDRTEQNAVKYDQPAIERLVDGKITYPVRSYITGQPSIDRAEKNASISNLKRNELIALGVLFVLLLIGLRAPVAALLVTAVGAVSTLAAFGEVALLGHLLKVDPVAVAAGTMTGLALAIGFSLLILDRFHQELRWPEHPRRAGEAALRELEGTGRAVLVAGTGLIVALLLVAAIGPTPLMVSVGTGVLTCAAFAVGGAVVVMPAAFVLLGRRIEAGSFPAPASLRHMWTALVNGGNWVTRRAVYVGAVATALLAAIAVPAFALKTGPPDVTQLPASSQARMAFQEVSRVMGPGWATPYNLIVVANNRPITTPAVLASLHRFELKIAQNKTVDSVTGPGTLNSTASQLASFGPQLRHSAAISEKSKKDLLKLIHGLGMAGSGSSQLRSGLAAAAQGAGLISGGSGKANAGAGQIRYYLGQALAGAIKLRNGAGLALSGANQLVAGLTKAHTGAGKSVTGLQSLASSTASTKADIAQARSYSHSAASDVNAALTALLAMGNRAKRDPKYGTVGSDLTNAQSAISSLQSQVDTAVQSATATNNMAGTIATQAPALVSGLQQLLAGESQLQAGLQQLHSGNGQLSAGLSQLMTGAGALEAGLGTLTNGAGTLASGLAGGVSPAGKLVAGLNTMQAAVVKARGQLPSTAQLRKLEREAPGMFNSGYFVLSAIEGATGSNRNAATFMINLLRGGTAGQLLVVSKYRSNDPRTVALGTTLDGLASTFARTNNLRIAVGGPAGNLGDLTSVTRSRIWVDVAALALAIILMLALALRAVLLPIVATAFGLLVAAASFGLLQLLFGGSSPPMGGPGYLDPITVISVFTVAFTITIVFATVLLMRTREEYLGSTASDPGSTAVARGLRDTAASTTGAGLLMIAALIPFTITDLLNIRALGIGVIFAVLLDVVIVRPVLLPAAEAVFGRRGWWPTKPPATPTPPAGGAPTANGHARRALVHLPHRRAHSAHQPH